MHRGNPIYPKGFEIIQEIGNLKPESRYGYLRGRSPILLRIFAFRGSFYSSIILYEMIPHCLLAQLYRVIHGTTPLERRAGMFLKCLDRLVIFSSLEVLKKLNIRTPRPTHSDVLADYWSRRP